MRIPPAPLLFLAALVGTASQSPPGLAAQEVGAVTGTVVDAETGQPVAGVRLALDGTSLRATTAEDGTFRIERVPPGERLLHLELEGYAAQVEEVVVDAGWTTGVTIELVPFVAMLDALSVEIGLPRRSEATGVVKGKETSVDGGYDALRGRLPGVMVLRPGAVGDGGRVLIRGLRSLSFSTEPVIYVDGIRIQSSTGAIEGNGTTTRYYSLDFIDPATIDRIEVIRGPATAARYGMDAAGGVILIYTKKGGPG
ncbi:MAG: TonB-dependent receptor plug domain-containing protein [Gemmatimonadota bacterium]